MDAEDTLARIREEFGKRLPEESERRDLLNQALVFADEVRRLYLTEKARADELETTKKSLEWALERMVEAERSREEFISNCSHELRTPLTPIMGWAGFLRKRKFSEQEVRESAETIERNAQRLLKIVDSLLTVVSIRRNPKRTLQMAPTRVVDLLEGAAAAQASGRPLEVSVQRGAEVATVEKTYLSEVVRHLVDNAMKFTLDESPIRLSASRRDGELIFSVSDQGPGIQPGDRDRLFGAFVQGDSSATRQHGGLGVGLHICRALVDAHGGRIWIEETPGGGATFRFSIPQRRAADQRMKRLRTPTDRRRSDASDLKL